MVNSTTAFRPLGHSAYQWRVVDEHVEIRRRWGLVETAALFAVIGAVGLTWLDARAWLIVGAVGGIAARELWRVRRLPSEVVAKAGCVNVRYPSFGGDELSDSALRYRLVRSFFHRPWSKAPVVEHRLIARREGQPDLVLVQVVGLSDDEMTALRRRLGELNPVVQNAQ